LLIAPGREADYSDLRNLAHVANEIDWQRAEYAVRLVVELATLAYFKWFNKYPLNSEFGDIRSSGRAINARAA
jgi:hypothetical protein